MASIYVSYFGLLSQLVVNLGGRVVTVIQSKDGNGETNDNMMTRQGDNVIFG